MFDRWRRGYRLLTVDAPPVVVSVEGLGARNLWVFARSMAFGLLVADSNYEGQNLRSNVLIRDLTDEVVYEDGPFTWDLSRVLAREWAAAIESFGLSDALFRIANGWRLPPAPA